MVFVVTGFRVKKQHGVACGTGYAGAGLHKIRSSGRRTVAVSPTNTEKASTGTGNKTLIDISLYEVKVATGKETYILMRLTHIRRHPSRRV